MERKNSVVTRERFASGMSFDQYVATSARPRISSAKAPVAGRGAT